MIKTLQGEHTCVIPVKNKNKNANVKWIADKLADSLSADINMSYDLMHNELVKKWGVNSSWWTLYKAKYQMRL